MKSVRIGTMEYLSAENIAVPHGFTTRLGGVSGGIFASMNLGLHRGDNPENVAKNYEILAQAFSFEIKKLVMSHQTHSDIVRVVTSQDAAGIDHHTYPESDALITCDPGVALWVFTADCTPILLYDPVTGAVGAVHAGWRGTANAIVAKAVRAMSAHFGCRPENLRAAIGPNIGPCCFETDADVPEAMIATLGDAAKPYIRPRGEKFHLDLKAINRLHLEKAGVRSIEISTDCTACQSNRFWSHRVTGGQRGSQGAIIVCK